MANEQQASHQLITIFLNIFLCSKIRQRISNQIIKRQKIGLKPYLMFVFSVIFLLGVNLAIFMYFQKPNVYEQIQCQRSLSLSQVKQYGNQVTVKIMTLDEMSMIQRMKHVKMLQEKINILSHPARRLSYDSFGYAQVQYAWAFKSQQFLLQMVIQSAVFYFICLFMSMMNSKKSQMKQTLKTEIFVMILLFLWQVDLIMTTQTRLHDHSPDFFDKIFLGFPIFQRRDVLKSMIIPTMNMVDIFMVYFVRNNIHRKIQLIGLHPQLRKITNSVSAQIPEIDLADNFEQKVTKYIHQTPDKFKMKIYGLNREILKAMFHMNLESIVPCPQILRINAYFKLPWKFNLPK